METFCCKLLSIIKLQVVNYTITMVLCTVAFIICVILHDDIKYKILLWVSGICLIITILMFIDEIAPIYNDYSNKSFVQLEDATIVSGSEGRFDGWGIAEVSIYTMGGNIIKLTTTDHLPDGEYKVNIIYAEKSKYLVDWEMVE